MTTTETERTVMKQKEVNFTKFPSMIKSREELKPGMIIYHVYGHLPNSVNKEEVLTPAIKKESRLFAFRTRGEYGLQERFCGDCGLDGCNHNYNRIFKEESDAIAFLEACKEAGLQE